MITERSCSTTMPGQYRGPIVPNSLPPLVLRIIIDTWVYASAVILLVLNDHHTGSSLAMPPVIGINATLIDTFRSIFCCFSLSRFLLASSFDVHSLSSERELIPNGISRLLLYPLSGAGVSIVHHNVISCNVQLS